ncbi:MAG: tetratricopeptide repeat protein [Rhodospirillales bacterium]|nr:tetratricopeptide repeat protein [Rhodospirillales bacterium]
MNDLGQQTRLQRAMEHHRRNDLGSAEPIYEELLEDDPDCAEALHGLGLIRSREGNYGQAVKLIGRAVEIYPDFASAWVNLGNNFNLQSDIQEAIEAYMKAIAIVPDNAPAHCNLGMAFKRIRDSDQSEISFRRAIELDPSFADPRNNLGALLREAGRVEEARECFEAAIKCNPNYAEAHANLAGACLDIGNYGDAVRIALKSFDIRTDISQAHANLCIAFSRLDWPEGSVADYARVVGLADNLAAACVNLGNAANETGDYPAAEDAFRRAIKFDPKFHPAFVNLSWVLRLLNRVEDAVVAGKTAIDLAPRDPVALGLVADIMEFTNRLSDAKDLALRSLELEPENIAAAIVVAKCERREGHLSSAIEKLSKFCSQDMSPANAIGLNFELGALYDRVGNYQDAMSRISLANQMQAETRAFQSINLDIYRQVISDSMDQYTDEFWGSLEMFPSAEIEPPIFLVGFPRSGTTLLETVLDSHSGMISMDEGSAIRHIKNQLGKMPGGYPASLQGIDSDQMVKLRSTYFSYAERHMNKKIGDRKLVDKMPLNMIEIGLARYLFPEAKIILALRHPCDVVLSCFMQNFRANTAIVHFNSIENTAKLYANVFDLWFQFERVLGLNYATIRYENLVQNLEAGIRMLLEYIELPWDEAVLDYAENSQRRRIKTPSYHQVSEAIYQRASGRWENYREFLEPVLSLLAPYVDALGYGVSDGPGSVNGA